MKIDLNKEQIVERKALVFAVDNNKYIPYAITQNTNREYTTFNKGKKLIKGLTSEQELVCPAFSQAVGVSVNSSEWTEMVEDYWSEFTVSIPLAKYIDNKITYSLSIDASYEVKNGKIYPVDLNDFILYNLMLEDDLVSKSEDDYSILDSFDFFMIDENKKAERELVNSESTMKVTIEMGRIFTLENSKDVIRQILINSEKYSYGEIMLMSEPDRISTLTTYANKYPVEFIKIAQYKGLATRSLILEMIQNNVLQKNDEGVIFADEKRIGKMPMVIQYFEDVTKEIEVAQLKQRLVETKLDEIVG